MSYQHKINPFLLNKILNFKLEEVNLEASKRSTEDDINFNSKEKRKNSTVEAVAYKKSKLDQMDKYNLCGNIPKTSSSSTNHQATEESTISTSAKSQNIYKIMDKKPTRRRRMYTKQEDIDIVKALEIENGSTVGPGLAGNSIWDKIYERCQDNENLRNRSASSLKFRFLQYIQPNLSEISRLGETLEIEDEDCKKPIEGPKGVGKELKKDRKDENLLEKSDAPRKILESIKKTTETMGLVDSKKAIKGPKGVCKEVKKDLKDVILLGKADPPLKELESIKKNTGVGLTAVEDERNKILKKSKKKREERRKRKEYDRKKAIKGPKGVCKEEVKKDVKDEILLGKADLPFKKLESIKKNIGDCLTAVEDERNKILKKSKKKREERRKRKEYSVENDKEIKRMVVKENGSCFGLALTKNKIWEKIRKSCLVIKSLRHSSASSLKSRFFEHIQPNLLVNMGNDP